jgi:hypothetical protein
MPGRVLPASHDMEAAQKPDCGQEGAVTKGYIHVLARPEPESGPGGWSYCNDSGSWKEQMEGSKGLALFLN